MAGKRRNKPLPVKALSLEGRVMSKRDFVSFQYLLEQTGGIFEAKRIQVGDQEIELSGCLVSFNEKSVQAQWKKILRICKQHGFKTKGQ